MSHHYMFHCTDVSGFVFSSLLKKWQLNRPVTDKKKIAFVDSRWMSGPAFRLLDVDPDHKQVRGRLHICLHIELHKDDFTAIMGYKVGG